MALKRPEIILSTRLYFGKFISKSNFSATSTRLFYCSRKEFIWWVYLTSGNIWNSCLLFTFYWSLGCHSAHKNLSKKWLMIIVVFVIEAAQDKKSCCDVEMRQRKQCQRCILLLVLLLRVWSACKGFYIMWERMICFFRRCAVGYKRRLLALPGNTQRLAASQVKWIFFTFAFSSFGYQADLLAKSCCMIIFYTYLCFLHTIHKHSYYLQYSNFQFVIVWLFKLFLYK
jgi:hypothetical protein